MALASLGLAFVAALAAGLLAAPVPARAQIPLYPDEVERLDVITIQQDGRNLYAINALTANRTRIRLDVDEVVLFNQSRGRVGVVLTDRRALGVTVGSNFHQARYRIAERAPDFAVVSDRVALVATAQRALGFVGAASGWIQEELMPGENVEVIRAGAAVGIATTNRRALGLAPEVGRFSSLAFRLRESLASIDAADTLATLRTDQRILVYSGPRASWTFRALDLD